MNLKENAQLKFLKKSSEVQTTYCRKAALLSGRFCGTQNQASYCRLPLAAASGSVAETPPDRLLREIQQCR